MKIKSSLRLYFVAVMIMTGSLTILTMSGVALNYFFSGLEMSMSGFMRSQAFNVDATDGYPVDQNGLIVATRWQDLPDSIQTMFDPNELELNTLEKHIKGIPLIQAPKEGYFVIELEREGERRYVAMNLPGSENRRFGGAGTPPFLYIVLTALIAIILFSTVLMLVIRQMSTPVEKLKEWAKGFSQKDLNNPVPDFKYSELNTLAIIIQSSLSSVQEGLEREQRFLGYASHELRTPIAVTRTNSELLRKMISKKVSPDKQIEVLDRIERAAFTMTDLTETLLWLNRQEDKSLPSQDIELGELLDKIHQELTYLLHGKEVNVIITTDDTRLLVPQGLCRIVLTNLVRNAFQHTFKGEVMLIQKGKCVEIINRDTSENSNQDDLGFGLGLELTERLIKQYGWQYENLPTQFGHQVNVCF